MFPLVFLLMGPVATRKNFLTKKNIDTPHYDQQIGIRPTKGMKVIDRWERHEQNTIRGMSGEALQARLLCVGCMPSFFLANRHNILIILQIFLLRLRSPHSCFFCFNPHYCSKKTGGGKCLNLNITRLLNHPQQILFRRYSESPKRSICQPLEHPKLSHTF